MPSKTLTTLFAAAAAHWPGRIALEDGEASSITYRELDVLARRTTGHLQSLGVRPGDRVGVYLQKSIDAVASILGIMRAGATYVPVDPYAPASRAAYILNNCAVRAIVLEQSLVRGLESAFAASDFKPQHLVLNGVGGGRSLQAALGTAATIPTAATSEADPAEDDLAYILYTSGSTGKPKGVMLSHRNAVSFVDWCSEVFQPTPDDRFSSHAPLHFDLSILDLYVPLKHGARVVLIGAEQGKDPIGLAALIAERHITVWYSTPSVLSLLAQYGKLERYDYAALRCVLFAGEVFPVKHLRAVQAHWPAPRYFNLYGPTETKCLHVLRSC